MKTIIIVVRSTAVQRYKQINKLRDSSWSAFAPRENSFPKLLICQKFSEDVKTGKFRFHAVPGQVWYIPRRIRPSSYTHTSSKCTRRVTCTGHSKSRHYYHTSLQVPHLAFRRWFFWILIFYSLISYSLIYESTWAQTPTGLNTQADCSVEFVLNIHAKVVFHTPEKSKNGALALGLEIVLH